MDTIQKFLNLLLKCLLIKKAGKLKTKMIAILKCYKIKDG